MRTLEQLLTIGSYAGLGLLLNCTADNESKTNDSDTEYISDDSGTYDTGDSGKYDTGDSGLESCVPWEQTFGGSEIDFINSVQQTSDGGYILAGHTKSSGAGNYDGWLIKTDADGNEEWEQTFGGSEIDYIKSVQQTTDGGYVLAGFTRSSGAGSDDGWLIKIAVDGSKQWEQTFGGSETNKFSFVQQTTDGGYILAGEMSVTDDDWNGWLVKTDANGSKLWEQTFSENIQIDYIYSAQPTVDGGYILAGSTKSSGVGSYDGWLVKTDTSGNKQWEQAFGGSELDRFVSAQQTNDGGYVMTGITSPSFGSSDGWLIKTDENGSKQWEQTFGGSESDFIYSFQQTTDGDYVLAGYTRSETGNYDGWLVKTDGNGSKQWEQTYGGSEYDFIYSVQQTTDRGYVLAGYTESSSGGENYDGWLVKTCDK